MLEVFASLRTVEECRHLSLMKCFLRAASYVECCLPVGSLHHATCSKSCEMLLSVSVSMLAIVVGIPFLSVALPRRAPPSELELSEPRCSWIRRGLGQGNKGIAGFVLGKRTARESQCGELRTQVAIGGL